MCHYHTAKNNYQRIQLDAWLQIEIKNNHSDRTISKLQYMHVVKYPPHTASKTKIRGKWPSLTKYR